MPKQPHKMFPLGMLCSHCDQWHDLASVGIHRQLQHVGCVTCEAEMVLAEQLLEEAHASLERVGRVEPVHAD